MRSRCIPRRSQGMPSTEQIRARFLSTLDEGQEGAYEKNYLTNFSNFNIYSRIAGGINLVANPHYELGSLTFAIVSPNKTYVIIAH